MEGKKKGERLEGKKGETERKRLVFKGCSCSPLFPLCSTTF